MRELRTAIIFALAVTVVLGLAYPLGMIGAAQVTMPDRADGESTLIAKDYSKQRGLFQARPSVTGYDAFATFFNNQGPNQKELAKQIRGFARDYLKRERPFNPGLRRADLPGDAVTTSASGVDPDISLANARIQANRVAEVRGIPRERVLALIDEHTGRPLLGLAGGQKSVNVVELNEDL
jgi:potassium-transporting ATPase KdpC subunit